VGKIPLGGTPSLLLNKAKVQGLLLFERMKHEISPYSQMKEQRHVKGCEHPKVVPWPVAAGISLLCFAVAWAVSVFAVAAS